VAVEDAAAAEDVVVEVDFLVAVAAFLVAVVGAIPGEVMEGAVEVFPEEATAVAVVTLVAAGGVTLAEGGVRRNASEAVLAGVTFPARLAAAAIFPHPTSRVEVSQDPAAAHAQAVVECQQADRNVLQLEHGLQPAAELHSCRRVIAQAKEAEHDPRKNPPAARSLPLAQSLLAATQEPALVTSLLSFPQKDLVTF